MYNKIEKFLLERFPSLWNTKLCWILIISLPIHAFFFMLGWLLLDEEKLIRYYYSPHIDEYFVTPFLLHLIISILLIVGWLVMLFKHNAFKNFYPSSPLKLFGQFVQYFIILSCSTLFSISFSLGVKTRVNIYYTDDYIKKLSDKFPFQQQNKISPQVLDGLSTDFEEPAKVLSHQKLDTLKSVTSIDDNNSETTETTATVDHSGYDEHQYYDSKIDNLTENLRMIENFSMTENILAYIPLIFILSTLIFCFRVTNLRTLLFTIIFSGILVLVLGIFSLIMALGGGHSSILWLYIITAYGIIVISFGLVTQVRKLYSGILLNFSLLFFVPATFGFVVLITNSDFFEHNFIPVSYFIFGLGFLFVLLYTHILHKWRALPE